MTHEKLVAQTHEFYQEASELLARKNAGYADSLSALSGFWDIANLTGLTPRQVCMVFMAKHIFSLSRAANGQVAGEPQRSRLMDIANYCVFMDALESAED